MQAPENDRGSNVQIALRSAILARCSTLRFADIFENLLARSDVGSAGIGQDEFPARTDDRRVFRCASSSETLRLTVVSGMRSLREAAERLPSSTAVTSIDIDRGGPFSSQKMEGCISTIGSMLMKFGRAYSLSVVALTITPKGTADVPYPHARHGRRRPEKSQPLLEAVNEQLGIVPNMFRLISTSPQALEAISAFPGRLAKARCPPQPASDCARRRGSERLQLLPVRTHLSRQEVAQVSMTPRSPQTATARRTTPRPMRPSTLQSRWRAPVDMSQRPISRL